MMSVIKLAMGALTVVASIVLLFLMATSELSFKDLTFAVYFGIFATLASVAFFVLTRYEDNEETNPAKEKPRR